MHLLCDGKMRSVIVDQHVNVKFLVKLGKSKTETLQEMYGDE